MKGCRPLTQPEIGAMERQLSTMGQARRNLALFTLGWQTGFRISELLSLRLRHIIRHGDLVQDLVVTIRKGQAESLEMYVPSRSRAALLSWVEELKERGFIARDNFVFQTAWPDNKAISRSYAWKIIRMAAEGVGLKGRVGTHSMRKTFAMKFFEDMTKIRAEGEPFDPLTETQQALGHEDVKSTIQYLGLNRKNTRDLCRRIFEESA